MKPTIALVFLALSLVVSAEEFGFVGKLDLDNDGVVDTIQSGPMEMFGNGGGPIVVTLSANGKSPEKSYVVAGDTRFAVEAFDGNLPARIWFYWRLSSSEGLVTAFTFTKDELKKQSITIYSGATGSALGDSLLATIFRESNVFSLDRVSPYTAPGHPDGHEWGK